MSANQHRTRSHSTFVPKGIIDPTTPPGGPTYVPPRAAPVQTTLTRRSDVETRRMENLYAGLGLGAMLLGVALAAGVIYLDYQIWRRWPQHIEVIVVLSVIGLIVSAPLIYFGRLNMWRNTIDEWRDSQEKKTLVSSLKQAKLVIKKLAGQLDVAQATIAEQKLENQRLREKLDERIYITSKSGTRSMSTRTEVDKTIHEWLKASLFDEQARPIGFHEKTGYISTAFPFRESNHDGNPLAKRCYDRLIALGLVRKKGNNYYWGNPRKLADITALLDL